MFGALRVDSAPDAGQSWLDPEHLWGYRNQLLAVAVGLCDSREEAEDLVQDTYADVLARPRRLRVEAGECAYLIRALHNSFVSTRRWRARRPETLAPPERLEAAAAGARDRGIEGHDALDLLAALPTDARQVLVAVDLVGLSYPEAAGAIGIRVGTVKSRLARARARLAADGTDSVLAASK